MSRSTRYTYDLFISYSRGGVVEIWVERFFYPELMKWLPEELPPNRQPSVFFDKNVQVGNKWPVKLRQALKCSRLLLPVLNMPYFGSPWCIAEIKTMLVRERLLGLNCEEQSEGLIYPVVFSNAQSFTDDIPAEIPDEIKDIQFRDMTKWATVAEAFESSKQFMDFESEVKKIAKDIAIMLDRSPEFDASWPEVKPPKTPIHPAKSTNVPRFNMEGGL